MAAASLSRWSPQILSVVRIVVGLLFLEHGTQKLFGFPFGGSHPAIVSLSGLQAIIELIGGVLIVLGLLTRPVAFLICGNMAVAYFMVHFPRGFYPVNNGGDSSILYCFIFLYMVFAGPGSLSVDSLRGKR
jgi:putative oxidoreductase